MRVREMVPSDGTKRSSTGKVLCGLAMVVWMFAASLTASAQHIDHTTGFASHGDLTANGSASFPVGVAALTDGGGSEAGSIFSNDQVFVHRFRNAFVFQLIDGTIPSADGITFCIQSNGPTALGPGGGGLGYGPDHAGGSGGIPNSVAIKFDLYNNEGEGVNSTGLFINGAAPTAAGSIDLTPSGINLHSGSIFVVTMAYNGKLLKVKIKDLFTHKAAVQTYHINIPSVVGGNLANVGFTGGTGGLTASQSILRWDFVGAL